MSVCALRPSGPGSASLVGPEVIFLPDDQVYIVEKEDEEVYYYRGWWYWHYEGYWYLSRNYSCPWVTIPPPFRVPPRKLIKSRKKIGPPVKVLVVKKVSEQQDKGLKPLVHLSFFCKTAC